MIHSSNSALRAERLESTLLKVVPSRKSLMSMTDEDLAMAYVDGDNRAFDILLDRNQQKLFSYILFVVRNRDIANDVFQDTFVKAIVKLHDRSYQPTGKFGAWLTRIAHNIIMDKYRILQNGTIVDIDDETGMAKLHNDELTDRPIEDYFLNEQTFADVKHLLDFLPSNQREVVFMRYFQDMSFKEIAEVTGVSINTALGRMHYAVNNLRRMVKKHNIQLNLV